MWLKTEREGVELSRAFASPVFETGAVASLLDASVNQEGVDCDLENSAKRNCPVAATEEAKPPQSAPKGQCLDRIRAGCRRPSACSSSNGPAGSRTPSLRRAKAALSRLSYRPFDKCPASHREPRCARGRLQTGKRSGEGGRRDLNPHCPGATARRSTVELRSPYCFPPGRSRTAICRLSADCSAIELQVDIVWRTSWGSNPEPPG